MKERAYQLWVDSDHLVGDMRYDVSLLPWPGSDVVFFEETSALEVPEPLPFDANFTTLAGRDLPVPSPSGWPVMSRRMLDVLLGVAPFEHRAIPCAMLDDTCMLPYYVGGKIRSEGVDTSGYVALHLTTHLDALDWERSVYEREVDRPDRADTLRRLVLREDVPLPPIFRLSAYPFMPFLISHAARVALEKASTTGVEVWPYDFGMGATERLGDQKWRP